MNKRHNELGLTLLRCAVADGFSNLASDTQIALALRGFINGDTMISDVSHDSCEVVLGNVRWDEFFSCASPSAIEIIIYHSATGTLRGIDEIKRCVTDVYMRCCIKASDVVQQEIDIESERELFENYSHHLFDFSTYPTQSGRRYVEEEANGYFNTWLASAKVRRS